MKTHCCSAAGIYSSLPGHGTFWKNLLLQGHWGPASNPGGVLRSPGTTGARDTEQYPWVRQRSYGEKGGREQKVLLFLMCLNWNGKEDISSWKRDPGATSATMGTAVVALGDGQVPEFRVGNLRNLSSFWL